jgi:hypothetical protein
MADTAGSSDVVFGCSGCSGISSARGVPIDALGGASEHRSLK